MRSLRWIGGLIIIATFVYFNFFVYQGGLLLKLINVLLFSILFILVRVTIGQTAADRIVATDILGVLSIGILALMGLFYNESFFMDIGLIWALLSFIASLSFAKILEGRALDD
jgi:multicomponent Na+:H+ antiporter subunit F